MTTRRVSMEPENRQASVYDLDRLRFSEKNEKGRVLLLDSDMECMFRHFVKNPPGSQTTGRYYACLGDFDTVSRAGTDADRCPACAYATEGRDVPVSMPKRQYAAHVAKYATDNRGEINGLMVLQMKAWLFGDDKFNKLVDRKKEHGTLQGKDIILTCTGPAYQALDMDVSPRCIAAETEEGRGQIKRLIESKFKSLEALLASQVAYDELMEAVNKSGVAAPMASQVSVAAELDQSTMESLFNPAAPLDDVPWSDEAVTEAVTEQLQADASELDSLEALFGSD